MWRVERHAEEQRGQQQRQRLEATTNRRTLFEDERLSPKNE